MEKSTTVGCEKMIALFDAGTFVEIGAYMKRASGELTGVVCGYGAVDGKLVYAFVQDSDRQKGAFDALQAEKIAVLYGMAMKNGAPVVGFFDSIGAFVGDGASVMSAYGKLLKVVSDASGMIPQIAVISGVCSGMAATVAAMFDVIVTVKEKSKLFVNAPFVTGKDVGSVDYVAQNGLASVVAESKKDANRAVATLLTMLPSNSNEGICIEEIRDNINRKLGEQLPSLMFMHVPPIESLHAVRKKYRTTYSKFPFVPNLEGDFGRAEELPGGFASRIFSSAKEIGCVGMFFAHQHQIAMSVMYEGVRLTWGLKTGRYSYIGSSMVGSTLITIDDQRNAFMVRYLYSHL